MSGPSNNRPDPAYVVGLFAAATSSLMVCAALVVALVFVTKGGDDRDSADPDRSPSSPTSSGPTPSDPAPSDPTTGPSESSDPGATELVGDGYRYELPDEWTDQSSEIAGQGGPESIDSLAVWGEQLDGSVANLLVEIQPAPGDDDPETLKRAWQRNVTKGLDVTPEHIDGIEVAGETSVGIRLERTNTSGTDIVQVIHLVLHDGKAFTIGMTAKTGNEAETMDALDQIIASWSWE